MKINACKICKNSVLNNGMCLGLAKNSDYSKLEPVNIGSSILDDCFIENSVTNAIINDENCSCQSFVRAR